MLTSKTADNIAPLDASLEERVAIDHATNTIYVEDEIRWTPLLQTWIARNKRRGLTLEIKSALRDEISALRGKGFKTVEKSGDDNQVNLPRALNLIATAASYVASDIHLQMKGEHTEIQFVIKGELRTYAFIGHDEGEDLARAFYQGLARTKDSSWNPLERQGAQIPDDMLPPNFGLTSARIIRGPSYPVAKGGAFMTIRLQYSETRQEKRKESLPVLQYPRRPAGEFPLAKRGLTEAQVEKLGVLMAVPNGIVIVTGPTGSGKTTLIYEVMKEKARRKPGRRQVTIEDPVEFPMDWAVQLPVTNARGDDETGEAFAECGRTALRMAPKTLFFGETRGTSVALEVIRGAQTGHDTWTTLHVSDPFQAVERWEMFDPSRLDRRIFCDPVTLRGLIGIRLLPCLCENCRISMHASEAKGRVPTRVVSALQTWVVGGASLDQVFVKGPGCAECDYDGTTGRSAVAEIIINDDDLSSDFITKGVAIARANFRARPDADPSMLESAIHRVLIGEVDPNDVEESVDLIVEKKSDRSATVVSIRELSSEIARARNNESTVSLAPVMGDAIHA
jgi:general secretion pathway protein E